MAAFYEIKKLSQSFPVNFRTSQVLLRFAAVMATIGTSTLLASIRSDEFWHLKSHSATQARKPIDCAFQFLAVITYHLPQ